MNGWQRLFTLILLLCGAPLLVLWAVIYSDVSERQYAWSCDIQKDGGDLTPDSASEYMRAGEIPAADLFAYRSGDADRNAKCWERIEEIASGAAYEKAKGKARVDLYVGLAVFTGLFAFIYAVGWALGWVWRGFFPRTKSP